MILRNMILANMTKKLARNWASRLPSCSQQDGSLLVTATNHWNLLAKRAYGSALNNDGGEDDQAPVDPDASEVIIYHDAPVARFNVPDIWPDVPIIAINRYPFFPGFVKKIDLKQSKPLINLISNVYKEKRPYIGVFVKRDNENKSETVTSISQLYTVGTFAHISEMRNHDGKILEMVVQSHRRIRILNPLDPTTTNGKKGRRSSKMAQQELFMEAIKTPTEGEEMVEEKPIIYAKTENFDKDGQLKLEITPEIKTKMQAMVSIIRDIVSNNNLIAQHIMLLMHPEQNFADNPIQLCDFVGTIVQNAEVDELQALMEETNIMRRMDFALEILEKELLRARTMREIRSSVEKKVQEQHHKYMLNEQLKAIKRELGIEKEDKQAVLEKLEDRLNDLKVPEYAMKVIKEEQAKLSFLDPHSSEFSISRNYLDWLTNIPWGKTSEEIKDVHWARKVLDEDHYGMKDVKERILEFIAVGILKQQTNGKILCFYGPPGVGKTSIAKSIAKALNRQYYRFSVGGMTDVAEIKGHRRTYIGAMPGKLIQCLKKVQTENPLILIDEVDKIGGAGYHGDPASALLEVLDPEQNSNFVDHFIDVPVDLSKILFICTANVIDRIPGPLKDRMEMIEVSGYVAEEKMEIAKKYLIPKCQEKCALTEDKLLVTDDAIDALIKSYCRESGVRNLEKHLEKIYRKAALRLVSDEVNEHPLVVSSDKLKDFVGREKFTTERLYEVTPPGVIMGLAWTAMGGSALYIEATLARKLRPLNAQAIIAHSQNQLADGANAANSNQQQQLPMGSLEATGHLGDVMKESMRTAYTVAKNVLMRCDPENDFLEQAHIHVHVPEGAVPKDGPSAGCTVVSALLSLALNQPAVQGIAMTGEISLTGKVLPIGGVKEKLIAAKRAGVSRVILPEENKKDFDDLAEFIKQGITVHFVSHYDQIFQLLFPDFRPKTG